MYFHLEVKLLVLVLSLPLLNAFCSLLHGLHFHLCNSAILFAFLSIFSSSSIFIICLHVHRSVFLSSTSSGCMVSGLHSCRDDQGKCVVSRHWSYPSLSLIHFHHFIKKRSAAIVRVSSLMLLSHTSHPPWPTCFFLLHHPWCFLTRIIGARR